MKILFTFLLAVIAFGCQQPKSQPNLDEETQALRKAAEGYQASVTPATMDAVKTFYSAEADDAARRSHAPGYGGCLGFRGQFQGCQKF